MSTDIPSIPCGPGLLFVQGMQLPPTGFALSSEGVPVDITGATVTLVGRDVGTEIFRWSSTDASPLVSVSGPAPGFVALDSAQDVPDLPAVKFTYELTLTGVNDTLDSRPAFRGVGEIRGPA